MTGTDATRQQSQESASGASYLVKSFPSSVQLVTPLGGSLFAA